MVAVPEGFDYERAVRRRPPQRSRASTSRRRASTSPAKGVHVDLIKLYGSMGWRRWRLADAIVDLVSTGGTLKANKLVAVEDIMPISSRLVVNQAALKLKRETLRRSRGLAGAVKKD